jgi:urate oxidase
LESGHCFIADQRATPTAKVSLAKKTPPIVAAGVENLLIAKTTENGFSDFDPSEFRTLADTDDRILATELSGSWTYESDTIDFVACRESILDALLANFIDHYSRSVQETLHRMGQAALAGCSEVTEIALTMPNKHHILADLSAFERENENEVFVVTDEPFGYISATLARE